MTDEEREEMIQHWKSGQSSFAVDGDLSNYEVIRTPAEYEDELAENA